MQDMDAVYRQHAQTVFKYLMSLTHDADLAEELTQETFYQAVRSIDRFDESCKITTWLCAIAKNQYFAYAKKHARLQVDPDVDLMSDGVGVTGSAAADWAGGVIEKTACVSRAGQGSVVSEDVWKSVFSGDR